MLNDFLNTPMMSIHAHQPFCTTLNDDMKAYLSIPFEEFHGWFPRLSFLHFNQIYLISHTQFICSSTARAAVNSRALLKKNWHQLKSDRFIGTLTDSKFSQLIVACALETNLFGCQSHFRDAFFVDKLPALFDSFSNLDLKKCLLFRIGKYIRVRG